MEVLLGQTTQMLAKKTSAFSCSESLRKSQSSAPPAALLSQERNERVTFLYTVTFN